MNAEGTLSFVAAKGGAFGRAELEIWLEDDAGAVSQHHHTTLILIPHPVILSVYPLVLPIYATTSTMMTISARYLSLTSSVLSNLTSNTEEEPEQVSVHIGGKTCHVVSVTRACDDKDSQPHDIITCIPDPPKAPGARAAAQE